MFTTAPQDIVCVCVILFTATAVDVAFHSFFPDLPGEYGDLFEQMASTI